MCLIEWKALRTKVNQRCQNFSVILSFPRIVDLNRPMKNLYFAVLLLLVIDFWIFVDFSCWFIGHCFLTWFCLQCFFLGLFFWFLYGFCGKVDSNHSAHRTQCFFHFYTISLVLSIGLRTKLMSAISKRSNVQFLQQILAKFSLPEIMKDAVEKGNIWKQK